MSANLKNMDLNLLVIFEAIYSNNNISRASERLGMSQPAVSNALARLRLAFDDPLFIRSPKGVEPTTKASELIHPVREALGLIGRHLPSGANFDLKLQADIPGGRRRPAGTPDHAGAGPRCHHRSAGDLSRMRAGPSQAVRRPADGAVGPGVFFIPGRYDRYRLQADLPRGSRRGQPP
jgi:Bacterial regulatory helix-turn-helix protein, lysR family